ncbi:hypothetical protein HNR23_000702 [Nocardiopsis mwathae]|uniref:Lipoprotein n=1 Tax=Nocardiopsis mwathae TaxID=1472723 RepID=A0A7X0D3W2_9ACTN|nr:hypothetical protein [Nocardiopsis mwathae]MBB6170642.1 hypothetical protein [Nocardiopsis mwathae]
MASALMAALLFASGCGGGADEADSGTTTQREDAGDTENREASGDEITVGALTFTPPPGMVTYEPKNDTPASLTLTTEDYDPDTYDGNPPAIHVFEEDTDPVFGGHIMISGQIKAFDPDAEFTTDEDVEVPGAVNAALMKSAYTADDGHATVQWDLMIGGEEEGQHFVLRYGGHDDEFDEQVAETMMASARVGEGG